MTSMTGAPTATQLLKRELRKKIRGALKSLSPETIAAESSQTIARFLKSETYQNASTIAVYHSMPAEFDTSSLLHEAFKSKKRVFLPRIISKRDHTMTMLEVRSTQELATWKPNSWGIREPPMEEGRAETPRNAALDVIIVPGLAFDVHGARCGQGMGFYDTFLRKYAASNQPMPRLVALTLSAQIVDSVPVTAEDWPVDEVLYAADGSST